MSNLDTVIQDLVIANRILAKEEVVDAYGHISIRHPDDPKHFFLSRSVAPDLVERDDIVELGLDGQPVRDETRALYLERFIHAAIFEARPDINAVVHAHAEDILPFGIAQATPLKPVIHSGSFIGANVPVWDIADKFGDTNLLVTNMEQGRDLAKCLANNNVALMRGHGFASAGRSLIEVVRMSVYLPRNARALLRAKQLGGEIKYLSQGEIDARKRRLQSLLDRDLARLGILGEQGRLRPHADQARRRAWAQPQEMNAATARPISQCPKGVGQRDTAVNLLFRRDLCRPSRIGFSVPLEAEPTMKERAMSATPENLESYLSGRWVRGEGVETRLVDPVKGDELATVSAKGVDLAGALDYARRQGQGGLRSLGYAERGKLIGAVADVLVANRAALRGNRHRQFRQHQDRRGDRHRRRHRHAEILRPARPEPRRRRACCSTRSRCGSPRRRTIRPST